MNGVSNATEIFSDVACVNVADGEASTALAKVPIAKAIWLCPVSAGTTPVSSTGFVSRRSGINAPPAMLTEGVGDEAWQETGLIMASSPDRQSVRWGKGVAVRVGLGGRREHT